jgi:hypothetical protein
MSAVSYSTNDGWCDAKTQGIGQHCFGDYYYPMFLQGKTFPWTGSPNPYPPIALEIYRPFQLLEKWTGARFALGFYIFLLAATVGVSIYFFIKHQQASAVESSTIILGTIASAPIYSILDRGNSAVLLFPILLLWIISIRNQKHNQAMLLIIAASILRPQFILLTLIFLFTKNYKLLLKSLIGSSLVTLLSFSIYGLHSVNNLTKWIVQLFRYQDYAAVASIFPVNISFVNSISLAFRAIETPIVPTILKLTNAFIFTIFVISYSLRQKEITLQMKINACLVTPIFFISTTFHYYFFIISLVLLNSIMGSKSGDEVLFDKFAVARIYKLLSKLLFIIVLIPWALPWSLFPTLSDSRGWPVIGAHWVIAQAVFTLYALWVLIAHPLSIGKLRK